MLEGLIGVGGGILVGATGAGLGLVVTPLLILIGYRPSTAIATGLLLLVASKLTGVVSHHRLGHLPGRGTAVLVAGGIGGAAAAWASVHHWLSVDSAAFEVILRRSMSVALLLTAVTVVWKNRNGAVRRNATRRSRVAAFLAVGLGSGASVAMTSLGSGSLLVPTLAIFTDWTVPQLAAGSNVFGLVVGGLSSALQARWGGFNWPMFLKVTVGLLPGVALGAVISRRIQYRRFVFGLSAISVYLGLRLWFS
jgi:uncharacterized membrane protein YfcA